MKTTNSFYSWRTRKYENGFNAIIREMIPSSEKNAEGNYCEIIEIQKKSFSTRAKAKSYAQRYIRFHNKKSN